MIPYTRLWDTCIHHRPPLRGAPSRDVPSVAGTGTSVTQAPAVRPQPEHLADPMPSDVETELGGARHRRRY